LKVNMTINVSPPYITTPKICPNKNLNMGSDVEYVVLLNLLDKLKEGPLKVPIGIHGLLTFCLLPLIPCDPQIPRILGRKPCKSRCVKIRTSNIVITCPRAADYQSFQK